MDIVQSGILEEETQLARYITFAVSNNENIIQTLKNLADIIDTSTCVIGIGKNILNKINCNVPELRTMPTYSVGDLEIPLHPMTFGYGYVEMTAENYFINHER